MDPIVLGDDYSITYPGVRACALEHGPVGLCTSTPHTDTGSEVFGVRESHGTPMYRLVEAGLLAPERYVQVGLRGCWPGEEVFAWQAERGITSFFMHDVRERGIAAVIAAAIERVGPGPAFLTVDIDVLDPCFAPGHCHPRARRHEPKRPPRSMPRHRRRSRPRRGGRGRSDPDSDRLRRHNRVAAERIVLEILTGIALRREHQRGQAALERSHAAAWRGRSSLTASAR